MDTLQTAPPAVTGSPRRILISTFGSLGDLNPYLALGQRLRQRGHLITLLTSASYQPRVEALGLTFRAMPPDVPQAAEQAREVMSKAMHPEQGTEYVVREVVLPDLREAHAATLRAATDADLLVSHLLTFATPIVAEQLGKPWVSTVIQPMVFFSAFDPPVFGQAPFLAHLRWLGPGFHRQAYRVIDRLMDTWFVPWLALRRELGLPTPFKNPLLAGQHSPALALAMFSRHFAAPQSDWPPQAVITGFPFFPPAPDDTLAPALREFLVAGPAPLVFTLGSSAVMNPGTFYTESLSAAERLGMRAVLLGAPVDLAVPESAMTVPFAPHSAIFRHAAATIHQGGIGTTAEALRAGKPMVVVPFSHDQPDNAQRIVRLGVGATIGRGRYSADRLAAALRPLLSDAAVLSRAEQLGATIRAEDGIGAACDTIDRMLARQATGSRAGVA